MAFDEWQLANERLWERLVAKRPELVGKFNTGLGWKAQGRFIKRGSVAKAFNVEAPAGMDTDPLTGEYVTRIAVRQCKVFSAEQVN